MKKLLSFAFMVAVLFASCNLFTNDPKTQIDDTENNGNTAGSGETGGDSNTPDPDPYADTIAPILILQVYGTGSKGERAVSHSFIELYNTAGSDVSLNGYTVQYSKSGTAWQKLDLSGKKIKAKSSFLILGKTENTTPAPRLALTEDSADLLWPNTVFDNKNFKIVLIKSTETLNIVNPFDIDGEGTKAPGYVDMFGSIDNDESGAIDAFETEMPNYLSKQRSARRKNLIDTDNNKKDFEAIDYRASGISDADLALYRPKNSAKGSWNPIKNGGSGSTVSFPALTNETASLIPVLKVDTTGRAITATTTYSSQWPPAISTNFEWVEGAAYALYNETGTMVATGPTDIKGRGNSTWLGNGANYKNPYTLKLAEKTSILEMPKHKRWTLLANHYDKTLLRTETAGKLANILDNMAWVPHSRQVAFYLNNDYRGTYQLIENIKLDKNRVNVSEISADNPGGGYLLEIDERAGEPFNFKTTRGNTFCCSDPDDGLNEKITAGSDAGKTLFQKIRADVQAVETALFSSNFRDPDAGYRKYLDVNSFIDWYLVNEITKNGDAQFYSSVYLYFDPEIQKFSMGPIWDFDLSLGNVTTGPRGSGLNSTANFYIKNAIGSGSSQRNWIYRLFEDPAFVTQVKERWNNKYAELLTVPSFIDQRAAELNTAQSLNFQKWKVFSTTFYGSAAQPGTYAGHITNIKNFLSGRLTWLNTEINKW
jgi:hypothetical protein